MSKKNIILIIIAIIVLAGVLYFVAQNKIQQGIILFYSESCPHCKNVEDYIAQNKVEDKIMFTRLEISNNQKNLDLSAQKATICKIDISSGVPIPFLWNNGKCIVGDQDIIKFFQDAIK